MSTALAVPRKTTWIGFGWFGLLLLVCYAPVLWALVINWGLDPDMGHGYFVPAISAFIIWQRRHELLAIKPQPTWWGLPIVLCGGAQLLVATMGVELFLARSAFILTLVGTVWMLGGTLVLRKLAFPLFLLVFMVPIPTIVYNRITFPLQILASRISEQALRLMEIPVLREGNVLELASQKLSVVEACSGIRSLLSLTFLSLVYGYFFEKRKRVRVVLFLATIPIAVIANASRVTATGIISEINPELARGFFHESTGWVIFMAALAIMVLCHQIISRVFYKLMAVRKS